MYVLFYDRLLQFATDAAAEMIGQLYLAIAGRVCVAKVAIVNSCCCLCFYSFEDQDKTGCSSQLGFRHGWAVGIKLPDWRNNTLVAVLVGTCELGT